jgi:hypothetical protein
MVARIRPYLGRMRGAEAALAVPRRRPRFWAFSHGLGDGARTYVHVAAYPAATTQVRVERMDPPTPLGSWCSATGSRDALVGGFFVRAHGIPLGELWIRGTRVDTVPFDDPWAATRSCVSIEGDRVMLGARDELPDRPTGDLLQAGPLLVAGHRAVVHDGVDSEGFSANSSQFDSDITSGRYPRAALGTLPGWLLAVVCDGRSEQDAGLTMRELAELMADLGADRAINLDGGGSTSLVYEGVLRNTPREEHGIELLVGRPVSTALVFETG